MTASVEKRPRWLKRELLVRLMLPLLAIVAATAGLGAYTAQLLTDRVFDHWLLDTARSVRSLVQFDRSGPSLDLPRAAEKVLLFDDSDRIYFSVLQSERVIAGTAGIPRNGIDESRYDAGRAYEASFEGRAVRVARIDVGEGAAAVTVLVAETLVKRQLVERELLVLLWPMAALVFAAGVAIMIAVRRTVEPLEVIATRWQSRSPASLQPIDEHDVPRELLPFTAALNQLLGRIREMLVRERQFAATAAHQLRTPLAALQLGLARAANADDVRTAREVIGELSQMTQRAARLGQQLLALGRLDLERRDDLDLRSVDLVALAQDVGGAHADQALAQSVDLELIAPTRLELPNMSYDLMAEALSNLLDNGIRYTPPGGRVIVEVNENPPWIRISDSGPGVPEDERHAVFERFVRGRRAIGEGSGLGLAIVHDIAALHGAKVVIVDSPWGGAQVTIYFDPAAATGGGT